MGIRTACIAFLYTPKPVKHLEPEWVFEMCLNGD
jgi:hypothetical protein